MLNDIVTPDAVIFLYRQLLSREPENDQVITHHLGHENIEKLISTIISGDEYKHKNNSSMARVPDEHQWSAYDKNTIIGMFEEYEGFSSIPAKDDCIVDYFGIYVPICYAKYLETRAGTKVKEPPFPGDSIRAGFIEYLALVESIRDCEDVYQMAEVGASYAPFSVIGAKLALRKNVRIVVLRPVEASRQGVDSIQGNFSENNLLNENVDLQVIQAAVVGEYRDVYFPDVDCTVDNGAAPQDQVTKHDLRGAELPMVKVKGIPLSFVIESFPYNQSIDLLHIDIQGSEYLSLPLDIKILSSRVKRVMLATHSRQIEGRMMEIFHQNGWELIAEEPCIFIYRRDLNSMEGMTIKDGSQYWINKALT